MHHSAHTTRTGWNNRRMKRASSESRPKPGSSAHELRNVAREDDDEERGDHPTERRLKPPRCGEKGNSENHLDDPGDRNNGIGSR